MDRIMPSLDDHQSNDFVKLLLIGDSKTGKTGSLVSLVAAGYKLRILDTDNLLDVLKYQVRRVCPNKIGNVEFRSIRDKYKSGPDGPVINGKPTAWSTAVKMLDSWKYDDVDLGKPAEWGSDTILVIDSLSRLCDAAYDYHEAVAPKSKSGGDMDARAIYGNAQNAVEKFIAMLTSDSFQCNVIVIAHVTYQNQPDGTLKGFPQGIGQKLSPIIPTYFPAVVLYTSRNDKRTMQINSTPLIDLGNPMSFAMEKSYPIETGLATFFSILRGSPEAQEEPNGTTKPTEPRTDSKSPTRVGSNQGAIPQNRRM
jgi:hypothetical protein